MRVTIAAMACLAALVRADVASAAEGVARPLVAFVCEEPSWWVDRNLASDAIGGAGSTSALARDLVSAGPSQRDGADRAPKPTEEGGTLWCVSPNDPRCAPLDGSGGSNFSLGHLKLGCTFEASLGVHGPCESAANSGRPRYAGSARDGVLGRLERPPRAA